MADEDVCHSNLEMIARDKVGRQVELHDELSSYHGQTGTIVETITLDDNQIVYTVEWSDGAQLPYVPACLKIEEQPTSRYHVAVMRVEREPTLLPYKELILYEWTEGDDHWEWVINAPVAEILHWALTVDDQPN